MRTILVTGSDTGVGKTWAAAEFVRTLVARGATVQIVKVVETGIAAGQSGDAAFAAQGLAAAEAKTLFAYRAALAPAAAARREGRSVVWDEVLAAARMLEPVVSPEGREVWRIFEGAGGIASPIDAAGHDWADFAAALAIERTVIVVPERLGAINHARLGVEHAARRGVRAGVWLNRMEPVGAEVSQSTREVLEELGIPLWGIDELIGARSSGGSTDRVAKASKAFVPRVQPGPETLEAFRYPISDPPLAARLAAALAERDRLNQRRSIRVTPSFGPNILNLSDNDYLDLAHDPAVVSAAAAAAHRYGTSASASPLITGWKEPHEELVSALCAWHGFACGMLWTSGYAANCAVLGALPQKGDLILADRLIHHSMIAGLGRSGARFKRYPHLDLDRLEQELGGSTASSTIFVVTESVFSMDGDYPDLARLAALKREFNFFLILDEAHALGWYGADGAGLAAAQSMADSVDVFVGTLGKTLASGGAYTLFRDEMVRDTLINRAGEFIYSTAIPPAAAAAAAAALGRIRELSPEQQAWQAQSRAFRAQLRQAGWSTLEGESPIVPVLLNAETAALELAAALREAGIWTAAVRPPTVPAGTSRLRFSLKRGFGAAEAGRVLSAMERWRDRA